MKFNFKTQYLIAGAVVVILLLLFGGKMFLISGRRTRSNF